MKLPITGVIPPMVTPLLENMSLDLAGLERLIEHLLSGGVHGIFLLGTNGEGPSLGYGLRKQLISEACRIVNKRVPILVGITDTSLECSLEIAHHSENTGADALVLAPPYYFPISQKEMVGYLENIVPQLPLPFLLYDIPSCTKLHLSLQTVKKAKELGAIGVKDSSGDLADLYYLIEEFKDSPSFSVIAGTELFLPDAVMNGGHGVVAGGANIYPRLFVDLYEASRSYDFKEINVLRQKVLKMHSTLYNLGDSSTKSIKAIKCALSLMNICSDYMAQPLHRFEAEDRIKIKNYLNQCG